MTDTVNHTDRLPFPDHRSCVTGIHSVVDQGHTTSLLSLRGSSGLPALEHRVLGLRSRPSPRGVVLRTTSRRRT
jgi:hypothetical protein